MRGGEPDWFQTTVWSSVRGAAAGREDDINRLVRHYRRPIVRFVAARMPASADPEAIADDVLLVVLDPAFLSQADRAKGRFRQLLLAVTRHVVADELRRAGRMKRGGGRRIVPIEELDGLPDSREDEEEFAGSWTSQVLVEAMARFAEECREEGRLEFDAVRLHHIEGLSLADVAAKLGRAPSYANVLVYRGRNSLRRHILEAVREYCSTREEFDEEVEFLLSRLGWDREAQEPGASP